MITIRRLEVRIEQGTGVDDQPYPTVAFILDGRDLREWVRRATPARSKAENYLGHPVSVDLAALLTGGQAYEADDEPGEFAWERWGGFTPLLGCTCTVIDCGPLLARIEVDEDEVRWLDLRDGYREELDYGLGFRFERAGYDAAIERAARFP